MQGFEGSIQARRRAAVPRPQAMAAIDSLIMLYFFHSPKSLSTSPGSGPFPSCLEASLVILRMLVLMGTTVGGS